MERGERLPRIVPRWIRERVQADIYALYAFGREIGAALPAGARVLDAGAGEGRYRSHLAHTRYVGVDLAVGDAMWDYSRLDAVCDLTHLSFGSATFDAVVCTQVIEHVAEPAQVLGEIARVLKPGGRLFLSAPQSWPQHQKPHDYFRYTSFGLDYLFQGAGLSTQKIRPMGGYFWFLSFQLQNINFWLFPRGMRWRFLTWPLRACLGFLFQLVLPLMLYYLDPLDRIKDETLGYQCVAVRADGEV
jgi:SAM-dependent methyltransferase